MDLWIPRSDVSAFVEDTSDALPSVAAVRRRVSTRLDELLLPAEAAVAMLFDQAAHPAIVQEFLATQSELSDWLTHISSPRSRHLLARLSEGLERRSELGTSDASWAVEAAGLIEEIRSEVAVANGDASSGSRLLFVGQASPELDTAVWAAVSAGFIVEHRHEVVGADEVDVVPDLVVILGVSDLGSLDRLLRDVRENFAVASTIVAIETDDLDHKLHLGSQCDVLLTGVLRPLDLLEEVRDLLARGQTDLRVVQIESADGPTQDELRSEGVKVDAVSGVEEAFVELASGRANALVVTSSTPGEFGDLIALVRSRPDTRRAAIVESVSRREGASVIGADAAVVSAMSRRADFEVPIGAGASAVAEALVEVVRRRSELGALARRDSPTGLPWMSGRTRGEQLLLSAQRQQRPVTMALIRFDATVPRVDIDRLQSDLGRQFRDNDVVVRRGSHETLVLVDGIGRRTAIARLGSVTERFGGVGSRTSVAEYPYDGRDFDTLLTASEAALNRANGHETPAVIGIDWQESDLRSNHDILLVEPDKNMAAVLRAGLRRVEVSCRAVGTADLALEELLDPTQRKPRLVVLEFDLPGLDGLSVLRQLDRAGVLDRLNVIMVGSRTRESDIEAAFELGVIDVVRKPLSPQIAVRRFQRSMNR